VSRLAGAGLARRRPATLRIALLALGWSLLVLGLLGGFLPLVPGWPFGVAGATILYVESRWFQRVVRRFRRRHAFLERTWQRLRAWRRARRQERARRKSLR
jgi:uncharacterized membrane protein YbaN (DUF454 family)